MPRVRVTKELSKLGRRLSWLLAAVSLVQIVLAAASGWPMGFALAAAILVITPIAGLSISQKHGPRGLVQLCVRATAAAPFVMLFVLVDLVGEAGLGGRDDWLLPYEVALYGLPVAVIASIAILLLGRRSVAMSEEATPRSDRPLWIAVAVVGAMVALGGVGAASLPPPATSADDFEVVAERVSECEMEGLRIGDLEMRCDCDAHDGCGILVIAPDGTRREVGHTHLWHGRHKLRHDPERDLYVLDGDRSRLGYTELIAFTGAGEPATLANTGEGIVGPPWYVALLATVGWLIAIGVMARLPDGARLVRSPERVHEAHRDPEGPIVFAGDLPPTDPPSELEVPQGPVVVLVASGDPTATYREAGGVQIEEVLGGPRDVVLAAAREGLFLRRAIVTALLAVTCGPAAVALLYGLLPG